MEMKTQPPISSEPNFLVAEVDEKDDVIDFTSEGCQYNDPSFLRDCSMTTETKHFRQVEVVLHAMEKNVSASHVLNKVCTTSKRHGRSQKVHARTTCVQENCFQDIENAVSRMFVTSNDATFSHYDKKIFPKKDYFYVTKSINFMSQKQEPF